MIEIVSLIEKPIDKIISDEQSFTDWLIFNGIKSDYVAPTLAANRILNDGLLASGETATSMIDRVAMTLFSQERKYDPDPKPAVGLMNEFISMCDTHRIVMGTPILTNAGRHAEKPLSSCSVLPDNFEANPDAALKYLEAYHSHSIGLGVNLAKYADPVKVVLLINEAVLRASKDGKHERRIGNIGTISVRHPKVEEIIVLKDDKRFEYYDWRFNFSIDCDAEFMNAVEIGNDVQMLDGTLRSARSIMTKICESAAKSGEPGLIFLDRFNKQNPTPGVGKINSVAPCAEMGLIEGEACQFGYLNLAKFASVGGEIDLKNLGSAVTLLTRVLDNAMDISIVNLAHPVAKEVMEAKRKIGIGLCGFADLLIILKLPYDSVEARKLGKDLLAFINYISKTTSVKLAAERGSAKSMITYCEGKDNLHYSDQPYLMRYAINTQWVSADNWRDLADEIREKKTLRQVSTIALPPTGRSGFVVGASSGIEPWFTVVDADGEVHPFLVNELKQANLWNNGLKEEIKHKKIIGGISEIPEAIRSLFKTATEISPENHLKMAAELQIFNDESISKTINLPYGANAANINKIYTDAYNKGLCGITVYVDRSRANQPISLGG